MEICGGINIQKLNDQIESKQLTWVFFFFFELSGDMYGMGENIKQTKNDQIESKSNWETKMRHMKKFKLAILCTLPY